MTQFKPGQSGNPSGRPKGNRAATQIRKALEAGAYDLVQKIKDQALAGDATAQKLWLERVCPTLRPVNAQIRLPSVARAATLTEKGEAVFSELAKGSITAAEASALFGALASQAKIEEIDELKRRVEKLEGAAGEPE